MVPGIWRRETAMGRHGRAMLIHGVPWSAMKCYARFPESRMRFHEVPSGAMKMPRGFMKCYGVPYEMALGFLGGP